MASPLPNIPPAVIVKDIYNTSISQIQEAIDQNRKNGNIAAANQLEAQVQALANYYHEQEKLNAQIIEDISRMAGNNSSSDSSSSSSSCDFTSGVNSATSSGTSQPGGIFGLFNK